MVACRSTDRNQELRFGDGFDISSFHDEVLRHGMLPLPVLAEVIDRWVELRTG